MKVVVKVPFCVMNPDEMQVRIKGVLNDLGEWARDRIPGLEFHFRSKESHEPVLSSVIEVRHKHFDDPKGKDSLDARFVRVIRSSLWTMEYPTAECHPCDNP